MKKETAIEWLEKEISTKLGTNDLLDDLYKQAKAMEKEQIIDCFMDASQNFSEGEANKYYNANYGGDK